MILRYTDDAKHSEAVPGPAGPAGPAAGGSLSEDPA